MSLRECYSGAYGRNVTFGKKLTLGVLENKAQDEKRPLITVKQDSFLKERNCAFLKERNIAHWPCGMCSYVILFIIK